MRSKLTLLMLPIILGALMITMAVAMVFGLIVIFHIWVFSSDYDLDTSKTIGAFILMVFWLAAGLGVIAAFANKYEETYEAWKKEKRSLEERKAAT